LATKGGSEWAFVGALKCKRSSGRFTERVAGKVAETRYVVAPEASSAGRSVEVITTTATQLASLRRCITLPGYRRSSGDTLTIGLQKGGQMAVVKTMGVIVVVLLVLWIIFSLVGVLTAIIKALLVVLIVVALCYGVYHFFKKH
jgi:Flp pilus assembly protein TadB